MGLSANFFEAQTDVGYQFFDATASAIGARVTSGIVSMPSPGSYYTAATSPANAVLVRWTTGEGNFADEFFAEQVESVDTDAIVAALLAADTGSGTLQAALERLNVLPEGVPVNPAPQPSSNPALRTIYLDTQDIVGRVISGLKIVVTLVSESAVVTGAKRIVSTKSLAMEENSETPGRYELTVERGITVEVIHPQLFGKTGPTVEVADSSSALNIADIIAPTGDTPTNAQRSEDGTVQTSEDGTIQTTEA